MINWIPISSIEQLHNIVNEEELFVLFKHSTRCSISSTAKSRLERDWDISNIKTYYIDLLKYREVSNEVANMFGVTHASPQIILVKNKKALYDASHFSINVDDFRTFIKQ